MPTEMSGIFKKPLGWTYVEGFSQRLKQSRQLSKT